MQTINRYGNCPKCNASWDGGDIVEVLKNTSLYLTKSIKEVEKIAEDQYGWTKENPKRFSLAIQRQKVTSEVVDNPEFLECPSCQSLFNIDTTEIVELKTTQ